MTDELNICCISPLDNKQIMEKLIPKEKKEKIKEGAILILANITGTTIALLIWGGIGILELKRKIKEKINNILTKTL